MLDWQLLHQGCPAYDLAYFLTGSFREVQIEEFGDRLLKAYVPAPPNISLDPVTLPIKRLVINFAGAGTTRR